MNLLPEQPVHGDDLWKIILKMLVKNGTIIFKKGEWVIKEDAWQYDIYDINDLIKKYLKERDQ